MGKFEENIREAMDMSKVKEVAQVLSSMWDRGDNFMKLAEYAMSDEREACAKIAQEHGEFCHREVDNGGSADLRERAEGACYVAEKIRQRS